MPTSFLTLNLTTDHAVPVQPGGGTATVTVNSGSSVYYSTDADITPTHNEGTIVVGTPVAFTNAVWLRSAGTSSVTVQFDPPVSSGGTSAPSGPVVTYDTPEAHGAKCDGVTDDTAAIKAAIANVITLGRANGSNYGEVWFSGVGTYAVKGALDTSQQGSAQIPIPIIPTTGAKFTLVLRARRYGAVNWHWAQTVAQPCTLFSSGISGTGEDGIIGGPKNAWTDPNGGGRNFSNMHLVLDGMSIGATHDCGLIYVDARHIALFNAVNGLACTTERFTTSHAPPPANANTVGVYFPRQDNNDNNGVDNLICYDLYYGFAFADHFRAQRIETIYCNTGGFMSDTDGGIVHGAHIDYWSCEGGSTVLFAAGSGTQQFPIWIGQINAEAQTGTYDIDDNFNALWGDVGWSYISGANCKLHNASHLRVRNLQQPSGRVTPPGIPATTVALANPFQRDAAVNVIGGTVTVVAVDGTATGLTPPCTVFVPTGKSITLTYTVVPTSWNWVLL